MERGVGGFWGLGFRPDVRRRTTSSYVPTYYINKHLLLKMVAYGVAGFRGFRYRLDVRRRKISYVPTYFLNKHFPSQK